MTTLVLNAFFLQEELDKKMSNATSMNKLKDTCLNTSSASSLALTQLLIDDNNIVKPNFSIPNSIEKLSGRNQQNKI